MRITAAGVNPVETSVRVGERVTFINEDVQPHDVAGGPDIARPDCREIDAVGFLVTGQSRGRRVAWTAAFGQNRETHGNLEAYLVEGTMRLTERHIVYMRAESVAKDILDAGFHPRGVFHRHRQSQIGALTLGLIRDLWITPMGRVGVGADATGYLVDDNLKFAYGSPTSFHAFVRVRSDRGSSHPHLRRHTRVSTRRNRATEANRGWLLRIISPRLGSRAARNGSRAAQIASHQSALFVLCFSVALCEDKRMH